MRRLFIAGNWKMNLSLAGAVELAAAVGERARSTTAIDVAMCPVFIHLDAVHRVLAQLNSSVMLGAQDMYYEATGAFTGEVSGPMLAEMGCQCVILGHSERRLYFHETDAAIHRKVGAAISSDLIPIVCVGETLDERKSGRTQQVIREQFLGCLAGHDPTWLQQIVIAYEPVWAIGTGQVATTEQAEEVHTHLRDLLKIEYNPQIAESVRIQYGGSVKPDNAAELLRQPNIDGALVGGASLSAESFMAILSAASDVAD